jgi:ribonucleoside-triphosphate reductase (thioredoxin)
MLTPYQQTIHLLKYSRFNESLGRRELFPESVERFRLYMANRIPDYYGYINRIADAMLAKELAPSMRLFAMAGPAMEQDDLLAYNCMFMTIDYWDKLGDLMFALMCGTGVGFSVEECYVQSLCLPQKIQGSELTITFQDSREGWAYGYLMLLSMLACGDLPKLDFTKVRPKGAPLKTTGGTASGPEPLKELCIFTICTFSRMVANQKVNPIDIYDICCKIADVVVQGGVRRSACIAIFSPKDEAMWASKQDCRDKPWRFNTNNSVMFEDETQAIQYLPKVMELVQTSGEPGILIRSVLKRKMEAAGRPPSDIIGVNPCGEIILRDMQVCNLTEVVVRPEYSIEKLEELVELATVQGLLQATMYANSYVTLPWATEEPLLGVSLTGLADDPVLIRGGCEALGFLRDVAHRIAAEHAPRLGLKVPTAITTVKPSGTVSKLMGCAPGIHPWFARTTRNNISMLKDNPVATALRAAGIPIRLTSETHDVFSFYTEAPNDSLVNTSAMQQLDTWRRVNKHWADHNVSCTIYVGGDEWEAVESWCKKNIGILSGITFIHKHLELAHVDYMPIEAVEEIPEDYPKDINWDALLKGDTPESITSSREFSCTGGQCLL